MLLSDHGAYASLPQLVCRIRNRALVRFACSGGHLCLLLAPLKVSGGLLPLSLVEVRAQQHKHDDEQAHNAQREAEHKLRVVGLPRLEEIRQCSEG